jgi:hypothetical protein
MIQQVLLSRGDTQRMVAWIPANAARIGIHLVIDRQYWKVIEVYPGRHEQGTLKRSWHCGGL